MFPPTHLPQWNLKHLAILIAALALGFAVFGVSATVLLAIMFAPFWLDRRGRRREGFYYVMVWYPLFLVLGLYITWLTAWVLLGHVPRSSLDDPKDITYLEGPFLVTCLVWITSPFAFMIATVMTVLRVTHPSRASWHWWARSYPLFLYPTICSVSYGLLRWDPWNVLEWFMD